MTNQLTALLDGREVGTVHYKNARLSFLYSDTWRADPNAYPLSLSMPLASAEHGHARIEAFLWGLLPDNDRVLANQSVREPRSDLIPTTNSSLHSPPCDSEHLASLLQKFPRSATLADGDRVRTRFSVMTGGDEIVVVSQPICI